MPELALRVSLMSRTYRARSWQDEREERERKSRANGLALTGRIAPIDFCGTKTQYTTQSLARGAANVMRDRKGKHIGTYKCPTCRLYHLTSHSTQE